MATGQSGIGKSTRGKTNETEPLGLPGISPEGPRVELTLSKEDLLFLGTMMVEAARMIGVRDATPDASQFTNARVLVEKIYDQTQN